MEDAIRKVGGATDFETIITYPNTETQIAANEKLDAAQQKKPGIIGRFVAGWNGFIDGIKK